MFGLEGKTRSTREAILTRRVLRPVILGLAHVHALGFAHRDVKMENIFVTASGRVKLGDFGFATSVDASLLVDRLGTLEYMAPELLGCSAERRKRAREEGRSLYGREVDCWAVGVLAHELVWGDVPYPPRLGEPREEAERRIRKKPFEHFVYREIYEGEREPASRGAIDFVGGCLRADASARLTTLEMLCHSWIVI